MVVERIAEATKKPIKAIIGDSAFLRSLVPAKFADEHFGLPTVIDILAELEKPGRDPRPEFKTATFEEGIEKISDLRHGMTLEGVVTNVTAFGAFVDIGVHQDGLVHISELSDRFVKDLRDVVKAGDVVRVRVKDVDAGRKRVALTMKSGAIETVASNTGKVAIGGRESGKDGARPAAPKSANTNLAESESALAAALRRAREK